MPNHVTNILTVKGNQEQVKEVINTLINQNGEITFQKFSPMPEELSKVSSPVRIVSQEEYDETKSELEKKLANGEVVWQNTTPITEEMQKDYNSKYGADNWYDWSVRNWGTKWDAYDGYKLSDDTIWFLTAWATPFNAILTLSEKFPNVNISVEYADENMGCNVGYYEFEGGKLCAEDILENNSEQAIKKSIEILGDEEYYLTEYIYDMSQDDINDDWYNIFLKIVREREYIDEDYPTYVNEYLLQQAVENEQFEYASNLRDILKVKN